MELQQEVQFSGHNTFVLRANWLKRLYDECVADPEVFTRPNALVRFGVGKNMVDAIRYWGILTDVIKHRETKGVQPTAFGHLLFGEQGVDPFLVTQWSRWWLHWKIVNSSAYTAYYLFRGYNQAEINKDELVREILTVIGSKMSKSPSEEAVKRDVLCFINAYISRELTSNESEESLLCPLHSLAIVGKHGDKIRFLSADRDDVPDSLLLTAIANAMVRKKSSSIAFHELMWGEHGPGRIFRMTEDSLLFRVSQLESILDGALMYSDQAGVRSVLWQTADSFDSDRFVEENARNEARR